MGWTVRAGTIAIRAADARLHQGDCAGPSASVCCGYMNFFATQAAATAWAASHPEISGGILDQARALQTGIGIFGQLLR
jgi:hypothetical protein